ncbi:MAG: phosphoribosylformylglycinamidine synthase subunit PurS [Thermodesulfovibrionia bacterium]|nr:phosphoribosylformylglycinamidine synthase subunit PurS [Thermodesulfovibrionia bacterium]
MKAKVYVTFKEGILDPQGKAVQHSLETIGFGEVLNVRQGKLFEVALDDGLTKDDAEKKVTEMAEKLLANPVMENFEVVIE